MLSAGHTPHQNHVFIVKLLDLNLQ